MGQRDSCQGFDTLDLIVVLLLCLLSSFSPKGALGIYSVPEGWGGRTGWKPGQEGRTEGVIWPDWRWAEQFS